MFRVFTPTTQVNKEGIMRSKRVTRYYAECGKGFWKADRAAIHEDNCKCWGNPKNKTCKTCADGCYANYEEDTGDGGYWECMNGDNKNDGHVNDLIEIEVDYISVGCEYHSVKVNE